MRLGLLGFPISHSLSPKLYQDLLREKLTSYELFEYDRCENIPTLDFFKKKLNGLNITAPYKSHFIDQIKVVSEMAQKINAVNTLAFLPSGTIGTNTDAVAVEQILKHFLQQFTQIHLIVLGDGSMAKLTKLIAQALGLSFSQLTRKNTSDLSSVNLKTNRITGKQNIIINTCSRTFVFKGEISNEDIFWDFNYSFLPHQDTLPFQAKSYVDGQEMLKLQAQAAIDFWQRTNP